MRTRQAMRTLIQDPSRVRAMSMRDRRVMRTRRGTRILTQDLIQAPTQDPIQVLIRDQVPIRAPIQGQIPGLIRALILDLIQALILDLTRDQDPILDLTRTRTRSWT